jgi:hypothetical protein
MSTSETQEEAWEAYEEAWEAYEEAWEAYEACGDRASLDAYHAASVALETTYFAWVETQL